MKKFIVDFEGEEEYAEDRPKLIAPQRTSRKKYLKVAFTYPEMLEFFSTGFLGKMRVKPWDNGIINWVTRGRNDKLILFFLIMTATGGMSITSFSATALPRLIFRRITVRCISNFATRGGKRRPRKTGLTHYLTALVSTTGSCRRTVCGILPRPIRRGHGNATNGCRGAMEKHSRWKYEEIHC